MFDRSDVRVGPLTPARLPAFLAFADRTTLGSLAAVRATRRPEPGRTYLCARYRDRVIGCSCWQEGHRHDYVTLTGADARLTGVYLCSSEVLPEFRGLGIGGLLYARRLAACGAGAGARTVSVEILGRGTPLSVAEQARSGLRWHLARGFVIVGHSREEDAGPVLARRTVPVAAAPVRAPCAPRTAVPSPRGPHVRRGPTAPR